MGAKEDLRRLRDANNIRRRRFEERTRAKGVIRLSVYVPEADAEEFKRLAREWVVAHLSGVAADD